MTTMLNIEEIKKSLIIFFKDFLKKENIYDKYMQYINLYDYYLRFYSLTDETFADRLININPHDYLDDSFLDSLTTNQTKKRIIKYDWKLHIDIFFIRDEIYGKLFLRYLKDINLYHQYLNLCYKHNIKKLKYVNDYSVTRVFDIFTIKDNKLKNKFLTAKKDWLLLIKKIEKELNNNLFNVNKTSGT